MSNKYLQQATGAFQTILASDLSTALQSFTAQSNANSTTTSTAFTTIPNCSLTQGSSGVWFVTGYGSFLNNSIAEIFIIRITDGTTIDTTAAVIAASQGFTAAAGFSTALSVSGIATSPSSQLTLQFAGNYPPVAGFAQSGYCGITAVRIG